MADPYRPEPRPTGLNTPNNPYYRRDRNVRVAREEESMQAFLTSGGGGTELDQAVQAMLAGTTGFVFDPSDRSTLWQDTAKTVPVTAAGQAVARMSSKFGAMPFDIGSDVDTRWPTWDGASALGFNGTSNFLEVAGPASLNNFADIPALYTIGRYYVATVANQPYIFTLTADNGALTQVQTLEGTRRTAFQAANALVGTGWATGANLPDVPDNKLAIEANYAGSGVCRYLANGVQMSSRTLGSLANTHNLPHALRIGASGSATTTQLLTGKLGRFVVCPFIPDTAQKATIDQWLDEVPMSPPASLRPIDPDPVPTPL
jgi:hypothetical protein